MPELQIDVTVANRFISSLSKSLQALCHGCMEFDSGIEIVGYININIDSGSKVDYVLNEKVLKSTTNSMTFVSNSFLAKKDQPKPTRDSACSPISDVFQPPPAVSVYQNRFRGSVHGSYHQRGPAPHSFMHRGSQKRSLPPVDRDWRMSAKRQRDSRSSYSPHDSSTPAALARSQALSASTPNSAGGDSNWPVEGLPEVNVKTEVPDGEAENSASQNDQDLSQASQDDNVEDSSLIDNDTIKRDPDVSTNKSEENETEAAGSEIETDFKGTFLEPSDDTQDSMEHSKCQADDSVGDEVPRVPRLGTNAEDKNSPYNSAENQEESSTTQELPIDRNASSSDAHVEYDEAEDEEGTLSQSMYSDAGEGSSDAGHFEVIEIDDEDEDVQAMFGGPQKKVSARRAARKAQSYQVKPGQDFHMAGPSETMPPSSYMYPHSLQMNPGSFLAESALPCSFCDSILETRSMFQKHMNECHRDKNALPFSCSLCQKGFFSITGLRHHIEAHGGRQFVCHVCDARFQHKHNLKRHVVGVHKLRECASCSQTFNNGPEFNLHVLRCGGPSDENFLQP